MRISSAVLAGLLAFTLAGCFDGGEPPNCPYLASKSKSRKDLKLASLGGLG